MPRLEFVSVIHAPRARVWDFYDTVDNLPRITPPSTKVRVVDPPARMEAGIRFTLIVRQPPVFVPLAWETIVTRREPPVVWVDEQGRGPFAYWHHEHHFDDLGDGTTRLRDEVTYRPPLGPLGTLADWLFIRRQLTALFAYRHQATREALEGAS